MTIKDSMAGLSAEDKKKLLAELIKKSGKSAPKILPLASGQKALWLLHQQQPEGASYNTPFALRLRSEVDVGALKKSFEALAARHPSLRTTFSSSADGQLMQTVHPELPPHFAVVDATGFTDQQLEAGVSRAFRAPFSLDKGPLLRGDLFSRGPTDHVLLITVHHIVYDGWSAGILQEELSQTYIALSKGEKIALPPVSSSYSDFVARQSELVTSPAGRSHFDYWQRKLAGELPLLALPADRTRTGGIQNRSGARPFKLDANLTAAVKALAQSEQVTPFVVLLSAYAATLGRLSRQEDVIIGSPTTGRPGGGYHDVVGYFVNPVALRANLAGSPSAKKLIAQMKDVVHEALLHQDLPFSSLVERLELERKPGVSPVFQATMTFQSSQQGGGAMDLWAEEGARVRWGHVELEPFAIKDVEGQFDLTLEMWEARGAFAGVLRFNKDLYDDSTVALWRGYFEAILEEMTKSPDAAIDKLAIGRAAAEKPASTKLPTFKAPTITEWFESQVAKTPDAIALTFNDTRLSYAELDARANVLAHQLRDKGVRPESLVGICVDRNAELVIGILGILKAGGAYVPLDPASPKERMAMILEDAEVQALVTETKRQAELPVDKVPTLYVDAIKYGEGDRSNPNSGVKPENAAYVIYTSGSTGKPKGVIVTHANTTRLFTSTEGLYDFGANDVWTLFHSSAFDFSVWELWGPLLYGGRLVVVPHWMTRSPDAFGELIVKEGVTVLNQTPSAFRALLRAPAIADGVGGKVLRWIIFGGEAMDALTIKPWFEAYPGSATRIVNMYGITETTVHVTYHLVGPADLASSASHIGKPIPDLEMRLLDEHGQPVPVGVPGEIYVGGAGVARGYLKRPELTAQRFIEDPKNPGHKLYRSGDLAIRASDGSYSYLGRIDHQVKIRGFRIELGEIQALLAEHPAVAEAHVQTFERSEDDRRIVAYVVPKEGASEMVLSGGDGGIGETHVGEWQGLYDELYARSDDDKVDHDFNIAGWNSSYSGGALSAEAMKEWVDHTVEQVLRRKPGRVLEIGIGTGLLLTKIAPHTTAYWGLDVSKVVVDMVARHAKKTPALAHSRLFHCPADRLEEIPFGEQRFDAVIINSVIQYFPSGEYLAKVIEAAAKYVAPGGFIFAGDIRNQRLLEPFHASITLAQTTGSLEPKALKERSNRRMAGEEELLLDPDFWWGMKERVPRISYVESRPKRGVCLNELTRFRYDVVMHVDAAPDGAEVSWGPASATLAEIKNRVSALAAGTSTQRIGMRGLRNSRVQAAIETIAYMSDQPGSRHASLEKLRRRVLDRDGSSPITEADPGIDPDALIHLAESLNLDVALDWARGGADGSYDAVFSAREKRAPNAPPLNLFSSASTLLPVARRANDPLRGRLERRLESDLRRRAQERLNEYMVPSSIMVLDKLPLTENGKVDRRALPTPAAQHDAEVAHVDPRTGEEEILASVFAELLGAERVGVHESFFDLGGHSLLATQVVSRIRTVFGVELPLKSLFESPTVAGLSTQVQHLRSKTGAVIPDLVAPSQRPAELPLSASQQRMWILDRVEETRAPIYVIPLVLRLRGTLHLPALEKSLQTIIARHEVLRTSFPMSGERAIQAIADPTSIQLPPVETVSHSPGASDAEILAIIQEQAGLEVSRPFDLARGPLFRMRLFRVTESDHVLVLTMHHAVSDGWSIGILSRELAASYNAFRSGREPALPPLPVQYADFSLWQKKLFDEGAIQPSIDACKARLLGANTTLEIPGDRPRPTTPSFSGGVVRFAIDRAVTTRLKDLGKKEGVTLYMMLLSAFATYLARISGQYDMILGSPVANRNRAATEPLIGFFVNTLALRMNLTGDPTFLELLDRVRKTTLDAYADQDVPFEKLVEAVSPERNLGRQPLVQAMFVLQNAPFTPPALEGLSVELVDLDSITSKFDLTLSMQETADGLSGLFEYSSELFDRARVERMSEHFGTLLKSVVAKPSAKVAELTVVADREATQIAEWSVAKPLPAGAATVVEMFADQTRRNPSATALEWGNDRLSYGELDRRSTQLAHHLRSLGVGPEKLVAISLPRTFDLLAAVLGVWKAGGAYVPVDPEYPAARIEHIYADSKADLLLSVKSLKLPKFGGRTVWLDDTIPTAAESPLAPPSPSSAAYVIYTSGSTGKPKGVVLEHRGLANIAQVQQRIFEVGATSAVLQFASFSFDASVWEITMALASGARLVLPADDTARAGEGLAATLEKHGVSHATLPPSTLASLPGDRAYLDLRTIISAGEACTKELVKKWVAGNRRFYNAYGPTEATICATVAELDASDTQAPSIGRPLPGLFVRILDPQRRLVPIGVPGELCIGGVGVGRGYLGLDAMTADRFITDPEGAGRLYRTGDLVRWRRDGTIEYLGRFDHQVKLRGYRIELGEIEAVLEAHPNVQQALALVKKGQLVAYVIGKGTKPTSQALREHSGGKLPDYMVPSLWVVLDAFPLTPNGKIDREKLPDPEASQEKAEHVAASSSAEQLLVEIWQAVLKKSPIGIHDNFFAVGGDSILGLQIIARATQQGLRLRPRQLFQHQTIAELAKVAGGDAIQAEQGPVTGPASLTPIQRWFFEQNRAEQHHFNMAMLLDVDPTLDVGALKKAIDALEVQHDALRLRFTRTADGWEQLHVPASSGAIRFDEVHLAGASSSDAAASALRIELEKLQKSLDLAAGPLLRLALVRLGASEARLVIIAHHLVFDAVSFGPIIEDLLIGYELAAKSQPLELQPKTTSFQHWSKRLDDYAQTPNAKAELDAWLAAADKDGADALPLDDAGASDTVGESSTIATSLEPEETLLLLSEVPKAYDVKVNEVLIAALARSLSAWSRQPNVKIDLEGHGREFLFEDVDISRTVGWFTALFPLRLRVGSTETHRETLARAKDALRRIPNGGIGWGILKHLCKDPSIRSRLAAVPNASVAFNYLGQLGTIAPHGFVKGAAKEGLGPLHGPSAKRPHRLEINAVVQGTGPEQKLRINWTFGAEVFQSETIERLGASFLGQLRSYIKDREQPAAQVRVAADFPAARLSAKDLEKVLKLKKR